MNKLPKALIYTLSLVLLAIGSAVAYQVFKGSNIKYKNSMIGEITVGQGQNQTTLLEFLEKSETALQAAQATINQQSLAIGRLEANVENFQGEILRLEAMLTQQQSVESLSAETSLTAQIQTDTPKPEQISSNQAGLAKAKSQETIAKQIDLTRNILMQIHKNK